MLLLAALALLYSDSARLRVAGRLSSAHLAAYARDGAIVARGVADAAQVAALRAAVDDVAAGRGRGPGFEEIDAPLRYWTDLELAARGLPAFRSFALGSAAAAVAARAMGSREARLLYDQLFVRARDAATPTPWHMDQPYWRVRGERVCSVFVALDATPAREGLALIPGSHRWPEARPRGFARGAPYAAPPGAPIAAMAPLDDAAAAAAGALRWDLAPGDAIVFHGRTVHGGAGNWGRALAVRYVGDGAAWRWSPGAAIPTAPPAGVDGEGADVDGTPLRAWPDAFPLAFEDPLFGASRPAPTTVVQWSKG